MVWGGIRTIMVWGGLRLSGRTQLVCVQGIMTVQKYTVEPVISYTESKWARNFYSRTIMLLSIRRSWCVLCAEYGIAMNYFGNFNVYWWSLA